MFKEKVIKYLKLLAKNLSEKAHWLAWVIKVNRKAIDLMLAMAHIGAIHWHNNIERIIQP